MNINDPTLNINDDIQSLEHPLFLYNSLTRSKTRFIPMEGKRVLWYMCGPTVYDQTHMGHGRTYVCFDYVRRILEDYFKYDVTLVMNITDIDDKIILRAAEQGYTASHPNDILPLDKQTRTSTILEWSSTQSVVENMKRTQELSSFWEKSFLTDMASLGVLLPECITRVSEYVPEIIEYVEKIITNGYAYESNGSVYFDTKAFSNKEGKTYGKLVPENAGKTELAELAEEGEGAITSIALDKRNSNDFALWKKSKDGEPYWTSSWGNGRPGWHIECSVMASCTLGPMKHDIKENQGKIDIHTGGIDLRFPHHDNEMAQCEAYYDFDNWVNYFVHTGHLNIQGLKMSKSLKNFVKISEILTTHTSRQIRFLFLMHKYNSPMDYSDNTMSNAVTMERAFTEFFLNLKATLRTLPTSGTQHWNTKEHDLQTVLDSTKKAIHEALCDDMNTPLVIDLLFELTKKINRHLSTGEPHVSLIVTKAGEYMTKMLQIFGLVNPDSTIGFPLSGSEFGTLNAEQVLTPVLDALCLFRDAVREEASKSGNLSLLNLCDAVRDVDMVQCGVRLEDREKSSLWKLEDKDTLIEEQARKREVKVVKEAAKAAAVADRAVKAAEQAAYAAIPLIELFSRQTLKYSRFDEDGLPTHDVHNEEITKSALKSIKKEVKKHTELRKKLNLL